MSFAALTKLQAEIGTSQVRSMSYMFFVPSGFNQGTGGWNTSQVSDISSFNQGIGGWNTSQASDNGAARGDLHLPLLLGRGRELACRAGGHLLPHGAEGQCTGNKDFQETFTGAVSQIYLLLQPKAGMRMQTRSNLVQSQFIVLAKWVAHHYHSAAP